MYPRPGRSTRLLALAILGFLGATLLTAAPASANTAPRITKATISTWMPVKTEGLIQWTPAFSYAARDDQGVTGFQVQRKSAPWSTSPTRPAKMSAAGYVWRADGSSTWLYPSRTSVRGRLDPGAVDCFRVRAKDAAGLTSAWTGWRCAHAPMRAVETWSWCCQPNLISGLHLDGSADSPAVAYVSTRFGTQRSKGAYCAKGVRVRVFKGPGQGKMNVFLGSSKVGTVSAWSRTSGWKWATVRRSTDACGRVRLVPLTRAPVQMTRNYVLY